MLAKQHTEYTAETSLSSSTKRNIRVGIFCTAPVTAKEPLGTIAEDTGVELAEENFDTFISGSNEGLIKDLVDGFLKTKEVMQQSISSDIANVTDSTSKAVQSKISWIENTGYRLEAFQEHCDAFVFLPSEIQTMADLTYLLEHQRPTPNDHTFILVNSGNFWDPILDQFRNFISFGTLSETALKNLHLVERANQISYVLKNNIVSKKLESIAPTVTSVYRY